MPVGKDTELSLREREVLHKLSHMSGRPTVCLTFLQGAASWRERVGPGQVFGTRGDPIDMENQRILGAIALGLLHRGFVSFAPAFSARQAVNLTELGRSVCLSLDATVAADVSP